MHVHVGFVMKIVGILMKKRVYGLTIRGKMR